MIFLRALCTIEDLSLQRSLAAFVGSAHEACIDLGAHRARLSFVPSERPKHEKNSLRVL